MQCPSCGFDNPEGMNFCGKWATSLSRLCPQCGFEYDGESVELGRTFRLPNVEVSALINLGLDYLALGQPERALSYLEPMLERVGREAFGYHRWRWMIRLHMGLAELSYATDAYEQALRYVEEGIKEAQRTSSQKYIALGWALRGKIAAKLGDTDTAGTEPEPV